MTNHKYFIYSYDPVDADFAERVMETADNSYRNLCDAFEIQPGEDAFRFEICPDVASFIRASGKTEDSYQPWMTGNANYEKKSLCILSPAASDFSEEEMLAVVRHEVVHIVFGNVSDKSPEDIPPLIAEGIAVYLAGQIDAEALDPASRPDVEKLMDEDFFFDHDGYNYSGVYMGFLVQKYGWAAFKKLYAEEESLDHYLYKGFEEEAIAAFHDDLKRTMPDEGGRAMILETKRLLLRPWEESDAEECYRYAKDPAVGPAAGWPVHTSVEDSRQKILKFLSGKEVYALVLKETGLPVGSIGLHFHSDLATEADEAELGYWLGVPYWGQGLVPEAAREMLRHAFEDLGLARVWCGYYDGNEKSRRVQEKLGFAHQWTTEEVPVPQMGEVRKGHANLLTREAWLEWNTKDDQSKDSLFL